MQPIGASEMIINERGAIYHLNVRPDQIADTIITVGDPDRVAEVSKYFDSIEVKKGKREFITHTGYIGKKRITVLSTGIGTDNIDIVFNELDALVNIDFETRSIKKELKSLDIIRIGTSGAVQPDIPMGTILASSYGLGFDALMHYYIHEVDGDESTALPSSFWGLAFRSKFSAWQATAPVATTAHHLRCAPTHRPANRRQSACLVRCPPGHNPAAGSAGKYRSAARHWW